MPKTLLQSLTGIAILISWLVALAVGLFNHDYEGLQLVTPVMLVYAGYIFGESFFQRRDS
jgi:hypothetical protein